MNPNVDKIKICGIDVPLTYVYDDGLEYMIGSSDSSIFIKIFKSQQIICITVRYFNINISKYGSVLEDVKTTVEECFYQQIYLSNKIHNWIENYSKVKILK